MSDVPPTLFAITRTDPPETRVAFTSPAAAREAVADEAGEWTVTPCVIGTDPVTVEGVRAYVRQVVYGPAEQWKPAEITLSTMDIRSRAGRS